MPAPREHPGWPDGLPPDYDPDRLAEEHAALVESALRGDGCFVYRGHVEGDDWASDTALTELGSFLRDAADDVESPPQRQGGRVSFAFQLDRPHGDVNAAFAEAHGIVAGFLRARGVDPDQRVLIAYWPADGPPPA